MLIAQGQCGDDGVLDPATSLNVLSCSNIGTEDNPRMRFVLDKMGMQLRLGAVLDMAKFSAWANLRDKPCPFSVDWVEYPDQPDKVFVIVNIGPYWVWDATAGAPIPGGSPLGEVRIRAEHP